jgi:small basic protein
LEQQNYVSVFIGDDTPEGGLSRGVEQHFDESVFIRSQMFFLMKALS